MRAVYFVLLGILSPIVAGRAQNESRSEAAIISKMVELAGDTAIPCGLVRAKRDFDAALACARRADSDKKSFWLALQLKGADSGVWEGIARDAHGTRYTFFYTSNKSGQPE